LLFDDWFDAIEDAIRARARGFIEATLEEQLSGALPPPRYGRGKPGGEEAGPSLVGRPPRLAQAISRRPNRRRRTIVAYRSVCPRSRLRAAATFADPFAPSLKKQSQLRRGLLIGLRS